MNTLLHKHFFAYMSDELVAELEVPAQTVLVNTTHPGALGHNVLKKQNFYVYTLKDINNPPDHVIYANTVHNNRVSLTLQEPAKLVPLYELQVSFNTDHSAYAGLHLQPIKVIKRDVGDYRPLRDLEHLLEVEFIRVFRFPIVRVHGEPGHEKAYLMLQYDDPSKEDMMKAVIDSEQFTNVVLEYSPSDKLHVTYGLNRELPMPAYIAQIELDFNKIVEKYNIRIAD